MGARVLSVIKGHDGFIRSAKVLKGCANYLTRKREPEVHPVKHLYPLELSLTHEYKIPLPTISDLPVDEPGLNYDNIEEFDDSFDAEDSVSCEPEGSDNVLSPPVQVTRAGRKVVPTNFYSS